jgi:hypothetical protein
MTRLIADLWYGRLPLARAFWEYAIFYGTLANLVMSLASLAVLAKGISTALGLFLHFVTTPYNVLMVVAVWRSAARYGGSAVWALLARAVIVVWAVVCMLA